MLPKLLKEFAAENSKSYGHHKLDSSVSRPMGSRYDEISGQYDRTPVDINPEVSGFGQGATRNQKNIATNRKARISVDLGFCNFERQKPKEDKPLEIEKIIDTHTVQHKQQRIREKQEEQKKQLKFETADKVNKIDKLTSEQIYEMVYEVVPEDEYEKKDNPSDSSATPQNSKMTKTRGNTLEKRLTFGSIANQESKNGSQTAFRKGNTNVSLAINSKSESQDSIEIGLHRSPQKKPNQNHQTTKRPSHLKRQATSTTANFRHQNSRASLASPAGAVKSATASPHARSRVYDAAKRGGSSTTNAENNYEVEEKSDKGRESFSRGSVAAVRERSETKLDDVAKSTDHKPIPISVSWGPQKSQINKNSTLKNKRGLNRLATFNVIDDIKEASIEAEELISPRKELALNSELESPFGKSRVASLNFVGNYDLSFASLQSSNSQAGHQETDKEQISLQNDSSSRGSPTPGKISLIRYGLNQNRLAQNLIEENPEKEDEYTSKVDLNDNDKRKINARRAITQKISAPSTPGLKKPIKSSPNRLLKSKNSEIKLVKDTISQIGLPQPAQRNLISEFPSVDSKDATPHPLHPLTNTTTRTNSLAYQSPSMPTTAGHRRRQPAVVRLTIAPLDTPTRCVAAVDRDSRLTLEHQIERELIGHIYKKDARIVRSKDGSPVSKGNFRPRNGCGVKLSKSKDFQLNSFTKWPHFVETHKRRKGVARSLYDGFSNKISKSILASQMELLQEQNNLIPRRLDSSHLIHSPIKGAQTENFIHNTSPSPSRGKSIERGSTIRMEMCESRLVSDLSKKYATRPSTAMTQNKLRNSYQGYIGDSKNYIAAPSQNHDRDPDLKKIIGNRRTSKPLALQASTLIARIKQDTGLKEFLKGEGQNKYRNIEQLGKIQRKLIRNTLQSGVLLNEDPRPWTSKEKNLMIEEAIGMRDEFASAVFNIAKK